VNQMYRSAAKPATAVNVLHKLDRASRHTAAPNAIRATIRIIGPRSEITTRDIACIIRLLFKNSYDIKMAAIK
jgi:hypothetical protein